MAQEQRRGCGYRRVGGLYLVGGYVFNPCDRLPLAIGHCPVCGSGLHFTRSMTEINPQRLWGEHTEKVEIFTKEPDKSMVGGSMTVNKIICTCPQTCNVCYPPDAIAFVMMVGEKYYSPQSFIGSLLRN